MTAVLCYTLLDVSDEHLLHSAERLWVSMSFSPNLISELKREAAQSAARLQFESDSFNVSTWQHHFSYITVMTPLSLPPAY